LSSVEADERKKKAILKGVGVQYFDALGTAHQRGRAGRRLGKHGRGRYRNYEKNGKVKFLNTVEKRGRTLTGGQNQRACGP